MCVCPFLLLYIIGEVRHQGVERWVGLGILKVDFVFCSEDHLSWWDGL